jgi:heptaprenylglyceryl phosphate synthase
MTVRHPRRLRPAPVVFRGGTVLTMDDAHTVLPDADVLVVGDRIARSGPASRCPRARSGDRRRPAAS